MLFGFLKRRTVSVAVNNYFDKEQKKYFFTIKVSQIVNNKYPCDYEYLVEEATRTSLKVYRDNKFLFNYTCLDIDKLADFLSYVNFDE